MAIVGVHEELDTCVGAVEEFRTNELRTAERLGLLGSLLIQRRITNEATLEQISRFRFEHTLLAATGERNAAVLGEVHAHLGEIAAGTEKLDGTQTLLRTIIESSQAAVRGDAQIVSLYEDLHSHLTSAAEAIDRIHQRAAALEETRDDNADRASEVVQQITSYQQSL